MPVCNLILKSTYDPLRLFCDGFDLAVILFPEYNVPVGISHTDTKIKECILNYKQSFITCDQTVINSTEKNSNLLQSLPFIGPEPTVFDYKLNSKVNYNN